MKYALVNDERQEAQPNLSGKCEYCGNRVISKCGLIKIWHWAHAIKQKCDPWWENETEWHRTWKGQFPKEWQECIQHAENGEKHRADIRTDKGFVIEFQYSPIKPEERQARENFYNNMIWIVDGLMSNRSKFISVWEKSYPIDDQGCLKRLYPHFEECRLLRDWSHSKTTVLFDFREDILWGLLPNDIVKERYLFKVGRNDLIECIRSAGKINFEEVSKQLIDISIIKKLAANYRQIPHNHMKIRSFQRHRRF